MHKVRIHMLHRDLGELDSIIGKPCFKRYLKSSVSWRHANGFTRPGEWYPSSFVPSAPVSPLFTFFFLFQISCHYRHWFNSDARFCEQKKVFFRFLQCLILLSKEVALNFVWNEISTAGCCRRPLVTRLYRKQEYSSGIKSSKKAENALKTKSALDEKKHQLMNNMSWRSKIWCLKIVD